MTVHVQIEGPGGIDTAKEVFTILQLAYPSYTWNVREVGGALIIKELTLSAIFGPVGMMLPNHKAYSWTQLKHDAVMMAGELLERCGMPRTRWTGQETQSMEGADPRFVRPW